MRIYDWFNTRYENIPEERKDIWEKGGYTSISELAQAKAEYKGIEYLEALKKARWQYAIKGNHIYSIYTNKLDDFQFNLLRTHLNNKSIVIIVDEYSSKKLKLDPVNSRQQALEDFKELKEFYRLAEVEDRYYKSQLAERYATKDICESYNIPYDLIKANNRYYIKFRTDDPQTLDTIKRELRIWAPVFNISVKLDKAESSVLDPMTQAPAKPTYAGNTGYYYMGDTLMYKDPDETKIESETTLKAREMRSKVNFAFRLKKHQDPDSMVHIINAYMQIKWYQEHLEEFFPHDTHYLCECGMPVNRHSEDCIYCGKLNDDKYPECISLEYINQVEDRI